MKQILSLLCIFIFLKAKSQDLRKDFDIKYEIEKLSEERYSVRVAIKNLSTETLYISNCKTEFGYKSEKIGFCDFSYSMITDPLVFPTALFYFTKLESGKTFDAIKIVMVKNPKQLIIKFDYLSKSKKLFNESNSTSEYALKCKDYVDLKYTEGKIKPKSQKFSL